MSIRWVLAQKSMGTGTGGLRLPGMATVRTFGTGSGGTGLPRMLPNGVVLPPAGELAVVCPSTRAGLLALFLSEVEGTSCRADCDELGSLSMPRHSTTGLNPSGRHLDDGGGGESQFLFPFNADVPESRDGRRPDRGRGG